MDTLEDYQKKLNQNLQYCNDMAKLYDNCNNTLNEILNADPKLKKDFDTFMEEHPEILGSYEISLTNEITRVITELVTIKTPADINEPATPIQVDAHLPETIDELVCIMLNIIFCDRAYKTFSLFYRDAIYNIMYLMKYNASINETGVFKYRCLIFEENFKILKSILNTTYNNLTHPDFLCKYYEEREEKEAEVIKEIPNVINMIMDNQELAMLVANLMKEKGII